jgi:hypothetical protein
MIPAQTFQVTKPNNSKSNVFRELMFIYDFVQKTLILKLTKFIDDDDLMDDSCKIDISKFRNLTTLEIQRIPIKEIVGLQQLRQQLQNLSVEKTLNSSKDLKDLINHCAGDNCSGFMWNSLTKLNLSYNNLDKVDTSFEFTPYLQFLNLSHNKIDHISTLVWLPNLKILNLSFNKLTSVPKLNVESYRRLQVFNISDNFLEDVSGMVRLDALIELDLSNNCILDHSLLLPLCTLHALRYLNLMGNPLSFHPKHRVAACRYLSKTCSTVQFQLDGEVLSKPEKALTGSCEHYYPIFGHRMRVPSLSRTSSSITHTPTTKSISNTPENASLSSTNSINMHTPSINNSVITVTNSNNSQRKLKTRDVVIEESGAGEAAAETKTSSARKLLREGSKDHLTTKKEIEKLREEYGSEWLYNQDAVAGYEERKESAMRRRLELGDILATSPALRMDDSLDNDMLAFQTSTPNDVTLQDIDVDKSVYKSFNESGTGISDYASALDDTIEPEREENEEEDEEEEEEIVISEPEDNEAHFIVVEKTTKDDLFLVISETTIKERDAMTGRSLTKWDLSTLQSVERLRSDLIRLNFDTMRKDKREREYIMEAKCCVELEKLLRDYLSSRPLSEMNQVAYKCPKCNLEFCVEIDDKRRGRDNGKQT